MDTKEFPIYHVIQTTAGFTKFQALELAKVPLMQTFQPSHDVTNVVNLDKPIIDIPSTIE